MNQPIKKNIIFKIVSQRNNNDMGVIINDILVETENDYDCKVEKEESQAIINILKGKKSADLVSIYIDNEDNIACTLDSTLVTIIQSKEFDNDQLKELIINCLKETLDLI